jgi:hypothetical protein
LAIIAYPVPVRFRQIDFRSKKSKVGDVDENINLAMIPGPEAAHNKEGETAKWGANQSLVMA